jgi:hypothetical protein
MPSPSSLSSKHSLIQAATAVSCSSKGDARLVRAYTTVQPPLLKSRHHRQADPMPRLNICHAQRDTRNGWPLQPYSRAAPAALQPNPYLLEPVDLGTDRNGMISTT